MPARTGIHRGDELEARREIMSARGTGNGDVARFEWFTQGLQGRARELGQFIEKKHAMMCQRDLARPWWGTAAHQRHRRSRVVRTADRSLSPATGIKMPRQAEHGRGLQGFLGCKFWQQADKALGQHRFAAAGRAHHQDRVRPCCGDLQRALRGRLPLDLPQIRQRSTVSSGEGRHRLGAHQGGAGALPRRPEGLDHLHQMTGPVQAGPVHQRGLLGTGLGQNQAARLPIPSGLQQRQRHGQGSPDRSQLST